MSREGWDWAIQTGGVADRPLFLCQGVTDKEEQLVASDTETYVQQKYIMDPFF